MEKAFEQNHSEQTHDNEVAIISALEQEIIAMEERRPDTRKEDKGYPKYEILCRFVTEAKKKGLMDAYNRLPDFEKHAVITRLENQAYHGSIAYEFVEKMRRDLYGTHTANEGEERVNFEKQAELEQMLQTPKVVRERRK